jgi:hypothetical protein
LQITRLFTDGPHSVLIGETIMTQSVALPTVRQPDTFTLHEIDVAIVYSVKGEEPELTYSLVSAPKLAQTFKGNEIRTLKTEIGTLVSVTLGPLPNPDVGGDVTTLSLLLPTVNLNPDGGSATVDVQAIFTTQRQQGNIGPRKPVFGQVESYRVTSLKGTASVSGLIP